MTRRGSGRVLTDLVQLDGVELGAQLAQQRLGGFAVRAVGLAEHGCGMSVSRPIIGEGGKSKMSCVPTALSSMMPCALVFAADMAAGVMAGEEAKKRRRNEMVGGL